MMGKLYIVATPIGNLADITFRAVEVLGGVDLILAEDTRKSRILLSHYKIKKPVISFHQHSRERKVQFVIDKIKEGKDIAYITEAGTPAIADPGGELVEKLVAQLPEVKIIPIPGASALTVALSVAGMPADQFLFVGYLPKKKGRQTLLGKLAKMDWPQTLVFYESPYRLVRTLEDLAKYLGQDKKMIVCRELTKMFEEIYRGSISEAIEHFSQKEVKGEITIVIYCD